MNNCSISKINIYKTPKCENLCLEQEIMHDKTEKIDQSTFFFFDFFFFSGEVLVVLSIEAIDGVLTEGGIELIDKVFESDKA